jgi:hypothetical protein
MSGRERPPGPWLVRPGIMLYYNSMKKTVGGD